MKRFFLLLILTVFFFIAASAGWYLRHLHAPVTMDKSIAHLPETNKRIKEKLNVQGSAALQFCRNNNFNTRYCFLLDMSIESGKQRFFVYDMQNNILLKKGLVTHGCCNQSFLRGRKYGNSIGCACTSLGKYKIGYPYQGKFGLAYKLYGLEASNSNAFDRYIVLHSMKCIPYAEVYPYPICQSDGCPAVAPAFLNEIATLINGSGKQPILMWIYE